MNGGGAHEAPPLAEEPLIVKVCSGGGDILFFSEDVAVGRLPRLQWTAPTYAQHSATWTLWLIYKIKKRT